MRLKTFHADTLAQAMDLVRETLGPAAIIVATHEDDATRGARVTAAVDPSEPGFDFFAEGASEEVLERLTDILEHHGVPNALVDRVIEAATDGEESGAEAVLAGALSRLFDFSPLPDGPGGQPLMIIGPPGVGKTVTCAKLAARAALFHQEQAPHRDGPAPVTLVAGDPVRIGAVAQLQAYADRLGASIIEAPSAAALAKALTTLRRNEMVVIDTPGTNPYELGDLAHIVELSESGKPDTVLVIDAGRDALEAASLAAAFRPAGPKRLVVTGLDIARRLGAILAAAEAAELALSDISVSPKIGDGLTALDAEGLARLFMSEPGYGPAEGDSA